jgi:hypothetical protein
MRNVDGWMDGCVVYRGWRVGSDVEKMKVEDVIRPGGMMGEELRG